MTHLIASIIISQVLRDSFLADASTTVMIAHVAPANCTSESALNTLRYAERLKAVATGSTASTASISVASPANGTASAASAASAASPAGAPPAVRTGMPYALAGAESGLPPPPASPARRPPRTPLPLPPASPARRATEGQAGLRSAVPSSPKVFKPAAAVSPAGRTAGAVAALNAYIDASSAGSCSAVAGSCSAVDASSAGSAAASAVDVCRDLLRVAYDADGWKQELSYLDALATRPGGVEVGRYFDRLETVMSERLQLLHALQARVPQLRAHYCGDALDAAR
jgi:hypothetical protein